MALTRRLVKGQNITAAEHDANIDHFEQNPDGILMPEPAGIGIKIDPESPDWGWHDLRSDITLTGAASDPEFAQYMGNIEQLQMGVGKALNVGFHIPHDYALGTDVFVHMHWSHNSALVTGGVLSGFFEVSSAKGHDQAAFSTPIVLSLNNVPASTIRYQHMIAEGRLSSAGGVGGLIRTEDIEPDMLLLCRLEITGNTMTGGAEPFVHQIDLHYQSTNIATKNKSPNFYGA